MVISTQDFTKGIDFTGLGASATAAQVNQLIEQGTPTPDATTDQGRGLVITTTDSSLGVPVVPDAGANPKWQRYIWQRRPYAGASSQANLMYGWNNNLAYNATYLYWEQITPDLSVVNANVTTAQTTANNALAAASGLSALINNINVAIGGSAGLGGTSGINGEIIAIQNKQATDEAAILTAENNITTLQGSINAASSAAAQALTQSEAQIAPSRLTGFTAPMMLIRSDSTNATGQWYNPNNEYAFITAIKATLQNFGTTSLTITGPTGGYVQATATTVVSPGALVAVSGNNLTLVPGNYMVTFNGTFTLNQTAGSTYVSSIQLRLVRVSDGTVMIASDTIATGFASNNPGTPFVQQFMLMGILNMSNSLGNTAYMWQVNLIGQGTGSISGGTLAQSATVAVFDRFGMTP